MFSSLRKIENACDYMENACRVTLYGILYGETACPSLWEEPIIQNSSVLGLDHHCLAALAVQPQIYNWIPAAGMARAGRH